MIGPLEARNLNIARARTAPADVLVVGGGINGVGIALDAASRGLRTVLVERDDIAVGTSSRSSKLIHGGLRYLEQFKFGLVREALSERHLLTTRLAPHLVHLERFIVPVYGHLWEIPYVATGLSLYDLLGGRRAGRFKRLSRTQVLEEVPFLKSGKLRGAFAYADGVFDDARFAVAVARTAERQGATVLTRFEVVDWVRAGGAVSGAVVRDRLGSGEIAIQSRVVIDATGVFDLGHDRADGLTPSRGAHLLIPRSKIPMRSGLTVRVPGRVVFVIPWGVYWLVGTTDVPHQGPVDRPAATRDEIAYLLSALADVLDVEITTRDIVSTYAGIRPLAGDGEATAEISREDSIEETEPGRVVVRGGKYTTYRKVAERAVDFATSSFGCVPQSPTSRLPLVGAVTAASLSSASEELAAITGTTLETARHLLSRYGSEAIDVAAIAIKEGAADRLVPDLPYLTAEATWAIRNESALSIDDVLSRRTRISLEDPNHGAEAAIVVGQLMGEAFGWSPQDQDSAVVDYMRSASIEYGVPELQPLGVRT